MVSREKKCWNSSKLIMVTSIIQKKTAVSIEHVIYYYIDTVGGMRPFSTPNYFYYCILLYPLVKCHNLFHTYVLCNLI